jgi:hypothetical protein
MANTYQLIASNVLTSGTTSVVFSSIPATFDDLALKISVRATSSGFQNYFLKVNSTASDYQTIILYGSGTSLSSLNYSGETAGFRVLYGIPGSDTVAGSFSNAEIHIPKYKDSISKPVLIHTVTENTDALAYSNFSTGYQPATAAISSLEVTAAAGLAVNSSFYLYGIKNS